MDRTQLQEPGRLQTGDRAMDKAHLELVSFRLNMRRLADVVMSLPLLGVAVCFISAYIIHDDINHTRCPVYNFLPSISAITGVSPQRYLWRLCMSMHILPRGLLAVVCYNHQRRLAPLVPAGRRPLYSRLMRATFWISMVELASLAGVTYVSNKENYPLHEKLFSSFLFAHSVYMLTTLAMERVAYPEMTPSQLTSARLKTCTFVLYVSLILGLLYYFWKHRFYCQELAFTWFAFCEYCLCACIMVFHLLVNRDVPDFSLTVGRLLPTAANGTAALPKAE